MEKNLSAYQQMNGYRCIIYIYIYIINVCVCIYIYIVLIHKKGNLTICNINLKDIILNEKKVRKRKTSII